MGGKRGEGREERAEGRNRNLGSIQKEGERVLELSCGKEEEKEESPGKSSRD